MIWLDSRWEDDELAVQEAIEARDQASALAVGETDEEQE